MKKLSPFEKAKERYQNAQKMMFVKEQLKKELPPRGSAANVKIIPLGIGVGGLIYGNSHEN
jgi:hypothetical protein